MMAAKAANAAAKKKPRGRPFPKGRSPNPAGMKPGTKHLRTILLAGMSDDDRASIVEKVIRQAKRGCRVSQKLIIDRTEPSRRGSPVKFALPAIVTVADVVAAQAAIAAGMSSGHLTPSEAVEVSAVIELQRRATETQEVEIRLAALERRFT
jgi:hypothetical protein